MTIATVEGVGADEDGAVCAEELRTDPELEMLRQVAATEAAQGGDAWLAMAISRLQTAAGTA